MNTEKWDAIAEAFRLGEWVPANGWVEWEAQAVCEAAMIRKALPERVDELIEVGCGVGRLTPYLAVMFPRIIATDTSAACRIVTRERCRHHPNVRVMLPASLPMAAGDAALVWGNLYDSDWSEEARRKHTAKLRRTYPIVLEGNAEHWMLYEATGFGRFTIRTFEP